MLENSAEILEISADIDISENLARGLAESLNCLLIRTTIRVNLNFLHCFCCCEFQKTKNSKIITLTANIFRAPRGAIPRHLFNLVNAAMSNSIGEDSTARRQHGAKKLFEEDSISQNDS